MQRWQSKSFQANKLNRYPLPECKPKLLLVYFCEWFGENLQIACKLFSQHKQPACGPNEIVHFGESSFLDAEDEKI